MVSSPSLEERDVPAELCEGSGFRNKLACVSMCAVHTCELWKCESRRMRLIIILADCDGVSV